MAEYREIRTEWGEIRSAQTPFRSQGVELWGTVTIPLPKRSARLPGVVLVHGPAATDRDYTFPRMRLVLHDGRLEPAEPPSGDWAIRPFKEIAECLSASGCIVFRYDKRGCGRSGGTVAEWTPDLLAADVIAGLALLKSRRDVDPDRLFLLGHSEGAVIASMLAGDLGYLNGLMLLAAPITPLHRLALQQMEHLLRLAEYPQDQIDNNRRRMEVDQEQIRTGSYEQPLYGDLPTAHWRSLMRHKPLAAIRRIPPHTSVLLLSGGKDWQAPAAEALTLYTTLKAAGHPGAELHIFPDLDHFLLEEPGISSPETYFARRRLVPRFVLQTVRDWAQRTAKGCTPGDGQISPARYPVANAVRGGG